MVITGVVDRIPERVSQLVYLDAAVPDDGQCLLDLLGAEVTAALSGLVQAYGDGWLVPADPSVDPRLSPQPMRTAEQPFRRQNPLHAVSIPHTYIYCTAKPATSIASAMTIDARQKAVARGWRIYELPTDHEPEQEAPDALAAILLKLAQG